MTSHRFARNTVTLSLAAAVLTSCFRHVERSVQLPDVGYLTFSSAPSGASVHAEGPHSYSFLLHSASSDDRFAVHPGTYLITVEHAGAAVIQRRIFVASGETKDVTR